MALAAIIVFIVFVLIGRIVFHYKLTGTSGIKFNLKSLSSCSFSAYSILVSVGWWGIVLLSILEFFDKFHPQFNFGITGIIIGFAFVLSGIFIANVSQYQMGKSWRYIGSKSMFRVTCSFSLISESSAITSFLLRYPDLVSLAHFLSKSFIKSFEIIMLSAESTGKKITQKCEIWARPTEQCLPRVGAYKLQGQALG